LTIAQKGMLSLVAFSVTVALTVDKLVPVTTFTMELQASLAVSAALFLISQRQHRRAFAREAAIDARAG
jgi:CHASE1-domain containing sensor protein